MHFPNLYKVMITMRVDTIATSEGIVTTMGIVIKIVFIVTMV